MEGKIWESLIFYWEDNSYFQSKSVKFILYIGKTSVGKLLRGRFEF